MSAQKFLALLPLVVLASSAVVVMLVAAFSRRPGVSFALTIIGLAATLGVLASAASSGERQVVPLLILDNYALFYIGLMTATALLVVIISYGYLRERGSNPADYWILVLLSTLGAGVLAASNHLLSLFLGLELLSIPLYALIAYRWLREKGVEAAIKYLILTSVTAAFTLFGLALIYAALGTLQLADVAKPPAQGNALGGLVTVGWALVLIGLAYKLAAVPFHMWVADVYEGAPAPVTALIATTSKGAILALLLRYASLIGARGSGALWVILAILSVASMVVGNLLALLQNNVKRILAYSSIAHTGYLLVAILAGGTLARTAVTFYLVAYFATNLAAFGVLTVLSRGAQEAETLEDYRGLAQRSPWLAAVMTIALLSLAGIPLTAGFVGKFYLAVAGAGAALWALIITLVLSSVIGLYYYARIIVVMYSAAPEDSALEPHPVRRASIAGLVLLAALVLWLGIYPAPFIRLVQQAVARLVP